ncbi:MAG: LicD family protein [Lachnospiraceae bacterium]|nr:LicD family protein [Lachnospiraceae bacterium]
MDILDLFVERCREKGYRYYLFFGTLLGAVREQQMMPWDDDVDVGMPRPDYDAFRKDIEERPLADNIRLFDLDHPFGKRHPFLFAKLGRTDTYIQTKERGADLGLSIDIWPFDGLPDKAEDRELYYKENDEIIQECFNSIYIPDKTDHPFKYFPALIRYQFRMLFQYKKVFRKHLAFVTRFSYDDAKFCGNPINGGPGIRKVAFPKEDLETMPALFEGKYYQIPVGFDEILRANFGDYMMRPPKEYRMPHDYVKISWKKGCEPKVIAGDEGENSSGMELANAGPDAAEKLPDDWKGLVFREDGTKKKVILYYSTFSPFLQNGKKAIDKLKSVLATFKENRDDVVLVWKNCPMFQNFLSKLEPEIWEEFEAINHGFLEEGWGIYDGEGENSAAIALSDAYYGDSSPIIDFFLDDKRPVMIENMEIL